MVSGVSSRPIACRGARCFLSFVSWTVVVAACVPSVRGQVVVWGGTSGTWSIGGNWIGGSTPLSGQDARVSAGAAFLDANFSVANFTLDGGAIDGAGTLDVNGTFNWAGGSIAGSGVLNANAGAVISGSGSIASRTVIFNGSTTWTGGSVINAGSSGTLINAAGGTFTNTGDSTFQYVLGGATPTFTNLGTFAKTGGTGTTSMSGAAFNNSGLLDIQVGTLAL
ncbi:MAG: Na-Ca exchanger/integrin-beta4, partial [Verrucomicrobia bacterium]|nr:Na-Ca exchanger/integrin-beta4 [Verrucomicrobiota bacterium]